MPSWHPAVRHVAATAWAASSGEVPGWEPLGREPPLEGRTTPTPRTGCHGVSHGMRSGSRVGVLSKHEAVIQGVSIRTA